MRRARFILQKSTAKKKRKELVEADLSSALLIAPNTEEHQKKAEEYAPTEIIWAAPSVSSDNVWMMLFETDSSSRLLVYVEMDEAMLRILRHSAPRVTSREKLATPNETGETV